MQIKQTNWQQQILRENYKLATNNPMQDMVREEYTVLNAPLPKTSSDWRNETEKQLQLRIISF